MKGSDHNSLVSHLIGYLHAMSRDIKWSYRTKYDWERDFSRLTHELGIKGSRILTLDLPALCKHLDRCLDQGLYTPSGLYLGSVPRRGPQVPVFLRDLYLQIFDSEGKLRESPNSEVIFHLRSLLLGAKKLRLPFSDRSMRNEIDNFIRIEQEIDTPNLDWDGDDLWGFEHTGVVGVQPSIPGLVDIDLRSSVRKGERTEAKRKLGLQDLLLLTRIPGRPARTQVPARWLAICQTVFDRTAAQLGDFSLETVLELPKHGPGAVAEGAKHINKYAFIHWPRKLQATFPADYYAHPTLGYATLSDYEIVMSAHEPPSRLIAVPKTQKGPRLIAAEPICHQWVQQLVKTQLEVRMESSWLSSSISFRDQGLSRTAAQRGSIDGSYATIDLSSASDRLSCWLVERAFRSNLTLLQRLHACRTRWLVYGDKQHQSFIKLRKFAPMGSAVTFPVQSIIYAMIANAAWHIVNARVVDSRSMEVASRQVRVFGDDIIIPADLMSVVVQLLEAVGLRVNPDKSFGNGNFREACGIDAWRGDDVTPPYILSPSSSSRMATLGSDISVRNNFYVKGFWAVAYWLDTQMSRYKRFVPDTHVGHIACGRASFLGVDVSHMKSRVNRSLQRVEVQAILPKRKNSLGAMQAHQRLFQWFVEKPRPDARWESGWTSDEVVYARPGWVPLDVIQGLK